MSAAGTVPDGPRTPDHARGVEVAIGLTVLAVATAVMKPEDRRYLMVGAAVLTGLRVVETYLGGLVGDDGQGALTAVHVPLAVAILGLAGWLLARGRQRRSVTSGLLA